MGNVPPLSLRLFCPAQSFSRIQQAYSGMMYVLGIQFLQGADSLEVSLFLRGLERALKQIINGPPAFVAQITCAGNGYCFM